MTETEEKAYLETVREKMELALGVIEKRAGAQYNEIMDEKTYLAENRADLDHAEKIAVRQSIDQMTRAGEHSLDRRKRLHRMLGSPYFGRIDFQESGDDAGDRSIPFYIGVHSFFDQEAGRTLIYDWRAPVSSMFYDFELGDAFFDSPEGRIEGKLDLKRQYQIEDGELQFMIDTSLNIQDAVLQKELSRSSGDKMKNIVATIQRDQNAVIRNEEDATLVIQGAAGSGKTSIALHRIAFLLYRFKDTISSSDIMILSPNRVFGTYIANVLPELGEESIQEMTMEELAADILGEKFRFQTFFEQSAELLEQQSTALAERIRFKASPAILKKLDEYVRYLEKNELKPFDIITDKYAVIREEIGEKFKRYRNVPASRRVSMVCNAIVESVKFESGHEIRGKERSNLRKQLGQMLAKRNLKTVYKQFYEWLEEPKLFKMGKGSVYEYADVFPLIYLKMKLEGVEEYRTVKHLVVDEMQDYTPVQYAVLARLFACKKTILGDSYQSLNPDSSSNADIIGSLFPNARRVYMNKSYRSTLEISNFAQNIQRNDKLEIVERHGEEPRIFSCSTKAAEFDLIRERIHDFYSPQASEHNTLALICKTQGQADELHAALVETFPEALLLKPESSNFGEGLIITSVHMAKGLEFDRVHIPFCTAENYRTDNAADRSLLYIAATRAMHRLDLSHSGDASGITEL